MKDDKDTKGLNLGVPNDLYYEISDYAKEETRKYNSKVTIKDTALTAMEIGIKILKNEATSNIKNR